jgi:hypothetical protein
MTDRDIHALVHIMVEELLERLPGGPE